MDHELPEEGMDTADYLHMVRDLAADPSAIYAAWMDLTRITSWWGPEGFLIPPDRVTSHRQVGGDYQACLVNAITGVEQWWGGEYRILDPPNRFEVTQQWQQADGTPVSAETLIDVWLVPLPDREGGPVTRMTLRQGPFSGDRELRGHETGWNQSFSRLAGYLARQQEPPQ